MTRKDFKAFSQLVARHMFLAWLTTFVAGFVILTVVNSERWILLSSILFPLIAAYLFFLLGLKSVMNESRSKGIAWMMGHFILLTDAYDIDMGPSGLLGDAFFVGSVLLSFVLPWGAMKLARAHSANDNAKATIDFKEACNISATITGMFFLWYLYASGHVLTAYQVKRGNALREFCRNEVAGLTRVELNAVVPDRFRINVDGDSQIELNDHGRGCRIRFSGNTAVVLYLLPRWGFPWSLEVPNNPPGISRPRTDAL